MSESDFEFTPDMVEETPPDSDVTVPQPEGLETSPASDLPAAPKSRESAADRLKARFNRDKGGTRPTEPSGGRRASRPKTTVPKPREGSLRKPLADLYTGVGLMLAPIDPVCSAAFLNNADACAKSLETLARENEAVRRAIVALTQTSAWGGVIIAHLPILLMVMTHHGPEGMRERTAMAAALMNPEAMAHMQSEPEADDKGEENAA